jgi:hypothetical protein
VCLLRGTDEDFITFNVGFSVTPTWVRTHLYLLLLPEGNLWELSKKQRSSGHQGALDGKVLSFFVPLKG